MFPSWTHVLFIYARPDIHLASSSDEVMCSKKKNTVVIVGILLLSPQQSSFVRFEACIATVYKLVNTFSSGVSMLRYFPRVH